MNEIDKALEELESLKEVEIVLLSEGAERIGQDTSTRIESGFRLLDDCIDGGFREGDFTIVSGIPGEGKTTLARMFTLNFAKNNIPSLWFSYEMTLPELWDSFDKMGADKTLISYAPLELNDDYEWIVRHMDKAVKENGVRAIFIDTLGDVVKSVKSQHELNNYANYLSQLCKDLRMYAIKNRVMIFAIAHAVKNTRSRSSETDNADIANSNGIPAQATNIFHVWRTSKNTIIKIGKSRRDGTKKNWQIKCEFKENKLVPIQASGNPEELW